jgi:hypothetical protein
MTSLLKVLSQTQEPGAYVIVLLTSSPPAVPARTELVTARNEGFDAYPAVVAQLDAQTHVIESACHLQWIVQRSVNPLRGVSLCRTEEALLRCTGHPPALTDLPDPFPEVS